MLCKLKIEIQERKEPLEMGLYIAAVNCQLKNGVVEGINGLLELKKSSEVANAVVVLLNISIAFITIFFDRFGTGGQHGLDMHKEEVDHDVCVLDDGSGIDVRA
jgi:hypothetical protein